MKHSAIIFLFLLGIQLSAQEITGPVAILEREGRKILEHQEFKERQAANDTFIATLKQYISTEKGFDDPLSTVDNMMRLELGDDARIYTWQMPDSDFNYVRYGVVAARVKDDVVLTELKEDVPVAEAQFRRLKPKDWYGAIYYEVIPVEKGKKEIYTLLGYAPGQPVNQKIVDAVEIDKRGRPRFGAKIFRVDEFMDQTLHKPPMRLVLSYGGDVSASVRWNDDEEKIVMDHLAPPRDELKGVYRMYGPDMSYDALVWEDDWWNIEKEVQFNTKQDVKIVPPDKPTGLPPKERGRNPSE